MYFTLQSTIYYNPCLSYITSYSLKEPVTDRWLPSKWLTL